jgi:hypothetical protein
MATAAPHPHPGFSGPPPGKRMRGIGRVLFWIGLVLVLASVTVGVIVAVMGFSRVAESAGNRIPVDGSAQVSVQQNERRLFFVPAEAHHSTGSDGETDTTYTPLAESNCTVEGPSAEELQVSGTHQFTENGRPNIADGGFIAREAGTYTVTCSPTPADAQVTAEHPPEARSALSRRGPERSVRAPHQCMTRRAIQLPSACANWTKTTSTTTMTATTTQSKRW